ncbi:MAG: FtsX-like permease family protein, partial [Actinocatenispora sp.]
ALALRLYLGAALLALLLAAGTVLVTAHLGARPVLHELAALRAVGVPRGMLRRAGFREYGLLLGTPLLVGAVAGGVGAALVMPHLPQVAAGATGPPPLWWPGVEWPVGALLTCGVVLALVTVGVVGTQLRRGTPERLREGSA